MGLLSSIFRAGGVIFLSLLMGAIALAYVGVEHPGVLNVMLDQASDFKTWLLSNSGLEDKYNVWVKFLVQEQQFVFMFFVIIMRLLLLLVMALLGGIYRWLWDVPNNA
ncbi:MAG: hypothetical protein JXQ99_05580 [Hyphomicrobiaceae bacterium]